MTPKSLIVFVKAPRPGQVKTRLARVLGAAGAARAYEKLVEATLSNLAGVSNVELRFAPDESASEIRRWLRPGWTARPQGPGDLGDRMARAFAAAFAAGARRVVVIGSDCPSIERADVEAAWASLRRHDVILGPASDGGYWLIALRAPQPALFSGIRWSTRTVLKETLERARARGLRAHLLQVRTDVDTATEWRRFLASRDEASSARLP